MVELRRGEHSNRELKRRKPRRCRPIAIARVADAFTIAAVDAAYAVGGFLPLLS